MDKKRTKGQTITYKKLQRKLQKPTSN